MRGGIDIERHLFYGAGLSKLLQSCADSGDGVVFAYQVYDPERYAVVEFDEAGSVITIEEKQASPKSSFAVVGLYF